MRALVTGACGFVGSALCRRLVEGGHEVTAVDDLSRGSAESLDRRTQLVVADLRDPGLARVVASNGPEVIFHLAAVHFIPDCERDPALAIAVNVEGTQRVLDASVAGGARGFVLASTAAVYAPSLEPHGEDSPLGPTDIYGHTKLWAEQLVELFHQRSGTPVAIARLFNVYGPGETNPHLIPAIIRQAERDGRLHLGNLSTKRSYVYVDDVADALIALGSKTADTDRLIANVGGSRDYDGLEIVQAIGEAMGRELIPETDAGRLRASDRPRLAADSRRAAEELGWRPTTALEHGLRLAVERPLAVGVDVE